LVGDYNRGRPAYCGHAGGRRKPPSWPCMVPVGGCYPCKLKDILMNKNHTLFLLLLAPLVLANEGGCQQTDRNSAARREQTQQNAQQDHILRTQPVPAFQWSLERHLAIEIYKDRQRQVPTTSLVQSDFTGKVMRQCDSICGRPFTSLLRCIMFCPGC
jgi:hypothetical protein